MGDSKNLPPSTLRSLKEQMQMILLDLTQRNVVEWQEKLLDIFDDLFQVTALRTQQQACAGVNPRFLVGVT